MKKILFATTALIATAGMAAAEIKIGGSGRFGVAYNEGASMTDANGNDIPVNSTRIEQRMRVNITGIATTDAGVKFEARIRLEANEAADNSISGKGPGAVGFAVSYEGLRVDVGHVSDAFDSGDVVDLYGYGVGLTSFIEQNATSAGITNNGFGAGGADYTTVKVRYSMNDFTVAASYSKNEKFDVGATAGPTAGSQNDHTNYQIGAAYNFGDYNVGAAFGSEDDNGTENDYWAASFGGSVGAASFSLLVTDSDEADDLTFGGSMNYAISSATDLRVAFSDGGASTNETAFGVGFRHSLGGGVSLRGGVGRNAADNNVADLGVALSF
ncbi:porin [Sedimentitalea sp. CY04]|uniref:Porin n=1 Tax=Parasedimentitalea denitrificans TaxID=2211118 RepID=A0ABX0W9D9_9RHOB|nr:porin [Sedimentitalea sp. CY04]NIZ61863.1 porin [Sedimentitalea sp. CY04]